MSLFQLCVVSHAPSLIAHTDKIVVQIDGVVKGGS